MPAGGEGSSQRRPAPPSSSRRHYHPRRRDDRGPGPALVLARTPSSSVIRGYAARAPISPDKHVSARAPSLSPSPPPPSAAYPFIPPASPSPSQPRAHPPAETHGGEAEPVADSSNARATRGREGSP